MIKKLFFSIVASVLLSFAMHKYYVSITEIAYNSTSQTLEVSLKFIGHDLEHALKANGVPEMYLGTDKELEKANDYLKKYIDSKFQLIVDGKLVNFKFLGKEVNNDDFIYCFIESEKIETPKKVAINNKLLIESFPKQTNTVYLTIGKNKITYTFNKEKVSETQEIIN